MSREAIFVQIAAYRDRELVHTLDSLLSQALRPERLRVCICWQHARAERLPSRHRLDRRIEIIDVDYRCSQGANWARRQTQRHWRGEPYSLIIDSHLRFVRGWDEKLVALLLGLKAKGVERPALTCYPPDFSPRDFPRNRSHTPLKIYKEAYLQGLLLHFAGHRLPFWRWLDGPIPAQFMALGLFFSEGRFNVEIPIDPNIYFFGDEITTGLRAYCHGYDLYHPHRVVAWHAYDRATRTCHWENHKDWSEMDQRSLRRVRKIFEGRAFKGYPLGDARTIADYERYIGLPLIESVQCAP